MTLRVHSSEKVSGVLPVDGRFPGGHRPTCVVGQSGTAANRQKRETGLLPSERGQFAGDLRIWSECRTKVKIASRFTAIKTVFSRRTYRGGRDPRMRGKPNNDLRRKPARENPGEVGYAEPHTFLLKYKHIKKAPEKFNFFS